MNRRRILSIGISLCLLCSPLGTIKISAHESGTNASRTRNNQSSCSTRKDPISNGLWAGANFNFSQLQSNKNASSACKPASSAPPKKERTSKQDTSKTPPPTGKGIYAGLGDSVAAGQGLDTNIRCDRSELSYPYIVARQQGLSLIHAACRSATVSDLFTHQHITGVNPGPQLDAAFAQGTPQLITITAGANDLRWFNFLYKCYTATCGTRADQRTIDNLQRLLVSKLDVALLQIAQRSAGAPPRVIITGYYSPTATQCSALQSRITNDEIRWVNQEVRDLNKTLQNASAKYPFTRYVPVNFGGHDLCSSDPWIQGLQAKAPLHPTARGQQAIAQSVLGAL